MRFNGHLCAPRKTCLERRRPCEVRHSALQIQVPEGRFVVAQTPVPRLSVERRGVVAEGAVGASWAGRFRIFRYEIRLWRNGHIPDVAEAVDSPQRLNSDETLCVARARPGVEVPTPVWGRMGCDREMWNWKAITASTSTAAGSRLVDTASRGGPPPGSRAGVTAARTPGKQAHDSSGTFSSPAPNPANASTCARTGIGHTKG